MRNIFLAVIAILFFSGCAGLMPVVDKNYVPDITLQELAEKMKNTVDPNGIYRKSTSYYLRQDIRIQGRKITLEVIFKVPNKSRTVVSLDNKILSKTVCNGVSAWSISEEGAKTEIKGVDLERLKLLDAMSAPQGTILDVFEKVEFAGEDKVYDSPCYVLICSPKQKEISPIAMYVSKGDYLTRKVITSKDGNPYIAQIRKYALVKGVMVGTETEVDMNDDGKSELMELTDYKLNLEIPDKEFE
ncbi:MAG TPA: hypothetical protein DCZ94_19140 [Lentisphaeria bacterium]|nr:MAG: hypothetical protein A2X48_08940 [Lentisphaerae bacterium GWF2_49_21]HBC89060.1 hypothetical protein [Lentisphaeria bacterium]